MHLNWLDLTILTIILLSIVISFFRGFLREVVSLVTWIIGLLLAVRFTPMLSHHFVNVISSQTVRYIVVFLLLFIVVFILGCLLNLLVKHGVSALSLGYLDRFLGSLFGAVRGVLLVAVALLLVEMTALKKLSVVTDSSLLPRFMPLVTYLETFLPKQLHHVLEWVSSEQSGGFRSLTTARVKRLENR